MGKFGPNKLVMVIVGILALIVLGTSVFIVDQAERAVITRFGRYSSTRGPGLHFKLPFGIDRNYTVNVTGIQSQVFGVRAQRRNDFSSDAVNTVQTSESLMLTGDLNIVNIEWNIQYVISDPRAWIFNVNDPVQTIRDVSRSAINMLAGDRAIMNIMGSERTAIENAALAYMNETFARYGIGINVILVKLNNVLAPSGMSEGMSVQQAFEDVNRAKQDLERIIMEGQQVYNEEIPKVRGQAQQMIQEAEGYLAQRVNKANGDVARFNSVYAEYVRAPEVTRQRLYYEMVEEVFKDEKGMVIIDRNLDNFLPLKNLGGGR